jgi:hypothetical protein
MPNPAELDPRSVRIPAPELRTAEIVDSATEEGQKVRCVIPAENLLLATDPLDWEPVIRAAGRFYPKKGDAALVGKPADGPMWLIRWRPNATKPDA